MTISNVEIAGFAFVGILIAAALLFLWYILPRVDAMFRPSLRMAAYWFIGIILVETVFMTAAG
jgi:hypothetical protein